MKKKVNVHLLPTMHIPVKPQPQHLYFTSDENIKDGDWALSKLYGLGKVISDRWADNRGKTPMLVQFEDIAIIYGKDGSYKDDGNKIYRNDCYKIVASSDKSLNLPQIPQSFIKQYVKSDGGIDEVEIEYYRPNEAYQVSEHWAVKVDSDNCAIVHSIVHFIKKFWTKEEVEDMLSDISTELCWDDKDEDELILNCQNKIKEIKENL